MAKDYDDKKIRILLYRAKYGLISKLGIIYSFTLFLE